MIVWWLKQPDVLIAVHNSCCGCNSQKHSYVGIFSKILYEMQNLSFSLLFLFLGHTSSLTCVKVRCVTSFIISIMFPLFWVFFLLLYWYLTCFWVVWLPLSDYYPGDDPTPASRSNTFPYVFGTALTVMVLYIGFQPCRLWWSNFGNQAGSHFRSYGLFLIHFQTSITFTSTSTLTAVCYNYIFIFMQGYNGGFFSF